MTTAWYQDRTSNPTVPERESARALSLSCSHTLIKSCRKIQWMDRWMDGAPLSLLFPSVLSFPSVRCSDAPVTETSRSQSGKKLHSHRLSVTRRAANRRAVPKMLGFWLVSTMGRREVYSVGLNLLSLLFVCKFLVHCRLSFSIFLTHLIWWV